MGVLKKMANNLILNNEIGQQAPIDHFTNLNYRFTGNNGTIIIHEDLQITEKLGITCGENAIVFIGKKIK